MNLARSAVAAFVFAHQLDAACLRAGPGSEQALGDKLTPNEPKFYTRKITIEGTCKDPNLVLTEIKNAVEMVRTASQAFESQSAMSSLYGDAFLPHDPAWKNAANAKYVREHYYRMARATEPQAKDEHNDDIKPLLISCDPNHDNPDEPGTKECKGLIAATQHLLDPPRITLCPAWFEDRIVPPTKTVQCKAGAVLEEYESKGRAIAHELAHLQLDYFRKAEIPGYARAEDIKGYDNENYDDIVPAYGVRLSRDLAHGIFKPMSHGGDPAPQEAVKNADNWAWLAAGVYWNDHCKVLNPGKWTDIPIGATPPKPKSNTRVEIDLKHR